MGLSVGVVVNRTLNKKTFFKIQPLDSLMHVFRHIDQLGRNPTKTDALHPDIEDLQSASVNAADLTAIDAKICILTG